MFLIEIEKKIQSEQLADFPPFKTQLNKVCANYFFSTTATALQTASKTYNLHICTFEYAIFNN